MSIRATRNLGWRDPEGSKPSMPDQQIEEDVRTLVREIVSGVLDSGVSSGPAPDPIDPPATTPDAGETIAVGADHGGLPLKEKIAFELRRAGHDVHDCGTDSTDAVDYPDFAHEVARLVADGTCSTGIVVDGAGIGSAMVANKVRGVFAGTCHDAYSAERLRKSNDAQIITLGAAIVGPELAKTIICRPISHCDNCKCWRKPLQRNKCN